MKKIVAAICFVIAQAQKLGQDVSQYDIVKTLFFADKKHLNDYGRPITFDNYCAMEHGPVPSLAYDLLKENPKTLQKICMKKLPWVRKRFSKSVYYYPSREKCSLDLLSPSDIEALAGALTTIRSLTFPQIRQLTHADPAYISAVGNEGGARNHPMDVALFFETPDYEAARALSFLSRQQSV